MADKTTDKEAKIDKIVKDAIDAQEKMMGKPMSSEARHAVREAVITSEAQAKLLGETIAVGTYALDGAGIGNTVKAEGAVAATKNAFSPSALGTAFKEASGLTGKGFAVLGRSAPLLNAGFAAYDIGTAETKVERNEAIGGFFGATLAAAGTGALIGSVVPGAGTLAVGVAGAFAGAAGYVVGKMTGGWVTQVATDKPELSKAFDASASGVTPPAPAAAPVQPEATIARAAPKLELVN